MRPATVPPLMGLVLLLLAGCSSEEEEGPTNLLPVFANAAVAPDPVPRGASCIVSVDVTDPDGTVIAVTADLTPFGGLVSEPLFDDGAGPDLAPDDGTWTLASLVQTTAASGAVTLGVVAMDNLGAKAGGTIPVTIKTNLVPVLTNPLATPFSAREGATILFTVDASDDGFVASVGIDLSTLGGLSNQLLSDDGLNGDAAALDGTWSYLFMIPSGQALGIRTCTFTATDDEGDQASINVNCGVVANEPPTVSNETATPAAPVQGGSVILEADASDSDGTVTGVTLDLSSMGGSASQTMYDDGSNGDLGAGDGTWTCTHSIHLSAAIGAQSLTVTALDDSSATGTGAVTFTLNPNPGPTLTLPASNPAVATGEDTVILSIVALDPQGVGSVTVDLSGLGGSATQAMLDDGVPPDQGLGDNTFTTQIQLSAHVVPGSYNLGVTALDSTSASSTGSIALHVVRIKAETTNFLYGLSGISPSDVLAGGEQGHVYHGSRTAFRMVDTKNPNTTKRQNGAFALSTGQMFTCGQSGSFSHFNGTTWSYSGIGLANEFFDLWGPSSSLIFAVGTSGNVHRWNGSAWSAETGTGSGSFHAIWGSSATDVLAVGLNNTVYHYSGSWGALSPGPSATYDDFFGVWGDGTGSTYYVVSADGGSIGISPFNGEIWQVTLGATPTWAQLHTGSADLYDIHGSSNTDIWAVGSGGTVLHSTDGSSFNPVTVPGSQNLYAVWSHKTATTTDVFVSGAQGVIYHFDGTTWTTALPPDSYPDDAWGITVPTATDAWMVDTGGAIKRYNAGAWLIDGAHTSALRGVWAPPGSTTDVFAAGDSGQVLHRTTAGGWNLMPVLPANAGTLYVVWGTGANRVFVGGADSTATGAGIWEYTGGWSALHTGFAGGATERIYALGGDGGGSAIYAGSNQGRIYRFGGGTSWTDITANLGAGPFSAFNGIWASGTNDVYAVGNNGTAYHYNGTSWSSVTLPGSPTGSFTDVCGTSSSDVYIVGYNMAVYRYDGSTWKSLPFRCTGDLLEADGYGSLVLFSGENGQVHRFEK